MAASATFALKAGEWFRRGRLLIVSPDSRGAQRARCQAETPLIVLFRFLEAGSAFFSEDALCWAVQHDLPPIDGLIFGSPNGLTKIEKDTNGDLLRAWADKNRAALGLDARLPIGVPSFHPVFRTKDNGRLRVEMVVEIVQSREAAFDRRVPDAGSFPFRGGVTLIVEAPELRYETGKGTVASPPNVRFAIGRSMTGDDAQLREQKQRDFAIAQGLALGDTQDPTHFQANFGLLHEEY